MHKTLTMAVLATALTLAMGACDERDPLKVKVTSGWLQGAEAAGHADVRQFLGVPYAAPPVDALRWKAPADVGPWTGVREATAYGNHCPQPDSLPKSKYGFAGGKEDCLYLNVYAPKSGGPYPVMVWIHGGAFYMGRSNDYIPYSLVSKGAVVVSINYRLGALGFLAHPALNDANGRSGNYGLLDQVAALRWVKANVAAFGGDPANVTLFGQSAGGASVLTHLVSPLSAGLFQKVIPMSGGFIIPNLRTGTMMQTAGASYGANNFGCPNDANAAACLRAIPADEMVAKQPTGLGAGWGPVVDAGEGTLLPDTITNLIQSGAIKTPVLIGGTRDEFTSLYALSTELAAPPVPVVGNTQAEVNGATFYNLNSSSNPTNDPTIAAGIQAFVNDYVGPAYPIALYGNSGPLAFSEILGDSLFACTGRAVALALSAKTGVWYYEFNDPNAPQYLQDPVSWPYLAYHASELQYIFDLDTLGASTVTDAQRALATQMVDFWYRFSKTGDPRGGEIPPGAAAGATDWPAFTAGSEQVYRLAPAGSGVMTTFATDHRCMLWTK